MRTASDYWRALHALLPTGLAWTRHPQATLSRGLHGLAESFARVEARGADLMVEMIPSSSTELLSDWERVVGLTETIDNTVQARRHYVVMCLTNPGGQSIAVFTGLAAQLGYTIHITECRPFWAGHRVAGDPLTNDPHWRFVWWVRLDEATPFRFLAGHSFAGEPLSDWRDHPLVALFNRLKPAHTRCYFITATGAE